MINDGFFLSIFNVMFIYYFSFSVDFSNHGLVSNEYSGKTVFLHLLFSRIMGSATSYRVKSG